MKLRGLVSLVGATAIGLASNASVVAGVGLASVNIVDTPRPQDRWGYAPVTRRIDVGTWVTWSNAGTDAHTVTAVDGSFDSGELDPSEGFSWYFDQPGTYDYLCTLHPWMEGTVVVGNGVSAADDTPTPPDDSSDAPAPEADDSGS
jgi:plastocyanin